MLIISQKNLVSSIILIYGHMAYFSFLKKSVNIVYALKVDKPFEKSDLNDTVAHILSFFKIKFSSQWAKRIHNVSKNA